MSGKPGLIDYSTIVYRGVESDSLDYKAAMNFLDLPRSGKVKFVRHCLALANTDGGHIVVGVGEDRAGHPSDYTGLSPEECKSFDPSIVGPFINRYADPAIDFTIERPLIDGKRYVIFDVKPFRLIPHVCTSSYENELMLGVFYIRTADASSRPAYRASEIHALIQRALRHQRESLARMIRGILFENSRNPGDDTAISHYEEDKLHSRNFFLRRKRPPEGQKSLLLELSVQPESFPANDFTLSEIKAATDTALARLPAGPGILRELAHSYFTNTSLRALPPDDRRQWQLFQCCLFHYLAFLPVPNDELEFDSLPELFHDTLVFLGNYYAVLGLQMEMLQLELKLSHTEGIRLVNRECRYALLPFNPDSECHISAIELKLHRSAAQFHAEATTLAAKLLRELGERFNLDCADRLEDIFKK